MKLRNKTGNASIT